MARGKSKVPEKEADSTAESKIEISEPSKEDTEQKAEDSPENESEKNIASPTTVDNRDDDKGDTGTSVPGEATASAPGVVEQSPSATVASTPPGYVPSDSTLKFFVGGIHPNSDEMELTNHFCKYGQVVAVQIMRDYTTGRHRGFGFVTVRMKSNSMDVFKDDHIVTGKKVDVRAMQTDAAASLKRKIFVGGLSKALNEQMLQEYFSRFGGVEKVTIMRQIDGSSRGFGFIVFSVDGAAEKALESSSHFVYGNKVDVRAAETRTKAIAARNMDPNFQYQMIQPHGGDMYSSNVAAAVYRPTVSKDYGNYYRPGTYDPQQYTSMTQQQLLQQQYAQQQMLQQQIVQQQLAMAGTYGNYYNVANQQAPSYSQDPSRYASGYGAYRGKSDVGFQSGMTPGNADTHANTRSYRQEPY